MTDISNEHDTGLALPTILPILTGKRIELRTMGVDDAPVLLEIYGDPSVMRYTDERPFENVETVFVMLRSVQTLLGQGESLEWAVVPLGSETAIGTCGLHTFDRALRSAEVGCLLRRSAWGNGYMSEAITLMTKYAKDHLGVCRLVADVHSDNTRAQQLFSKLGFRRDDAESWVLGFVDPR